MSYALLFDIGNVIVSFDFQIAARRVAPDCAVQAEEILPNVSGLINELESGQISSDLFLDQAIEKVGFTGERNQLISAFQEVFDLNQEMEELIRNESTRGIPMYLLSNTNDIHIPYLFESYPVFQLFNGAIYSHRVGSMKPDAGIYIQAIRTLELDPQRTIYIDDRADNCEAGKTHGFQSICYDKQNHREFLDQFELSKKPDPIVITAMKYSKAFWICLMLPFTPVWTAPKTTAQRIVDAAVFRTTQSVRYVPDYVVIDYPGGDVPPDTGVCTDVVIRTYRALGIDLQKLVHEDMKRHFSAYPGNWGLRRPDKNIDHRRVPNLQTFFKRNGAELKRNASTRYLPGDLVAWDLNPAGRTITHIGIVVGEDEFVHNIGSGPVKASGIETQGWKILGHYRFHPQLPETG